jgi:hypothetical protein
LKVAQSVPLPFHGHSKEFVGNFVDTVRNLLHGILGLGGKAFRVIVVQVGASQVKVAIKGILKL